MTKLKMHTPNKADENFQKLAALFPNAVTETIDENGEVVRAIDKDVLMQEINTHVVDGKEERYQFTWPDKKKAILTANAPISKTLRPCREESVDFDNTENLYIEGDNLDVLKLLQETYLGKIKMIYIDPPYNTGNDFIYNDDFAESADEYLDRSGQFDEDGNRLVQNTESNGRFHTDWLNMIYPRLKLAKDLLADDGVIFISIDDNEQENLKKCCDEVFGSENFLAEFVWQKKSSGGQHANFVLDFHEYVTCYSRSIHDMQGLSVDRTEEQLDSFIYEDEYVGSRGKYLLSPLKSWLDYRPTLIYDIECPDGSKINTQWVCAKNTFAQLKLEGRIVFKQNRNGEWSVYKKQYSKENGGKVKPASLIVGHGQTANGKRELKTLFNADVMSFPKPIDLIRYICSSVDSSENDYFLDFFSGSATTAHAVMQLNAEDGGNRKFIMVQLPEETDEKSEAYKAGYKNICEIGKERIRRAGAKIQEKNQAEMDEYNSKIKVLDNNPNGKGIPIEEDKPLPVPDVGFRVLKLDSTNMKDVYYNPTEFEPSFLDSLADNIKEDRTPEDLLFQVMLDLGILLSSKIKESVIDGKKVFNVEDNYLIACFDENVTDETITAIAKQKPYYFVMRDSSMATDSVATNFEQIFATYSPDTVRRVL